MVIDRRARRFLAEVQVLLTRIEVRLEKLESAVKAGLGN
jgi:hypothetical protein